MSSASIPTTFSFAVEDSSPPLPPPLEVRLLDLSGNQLADSPFFCPSAPAEQVPAGLLQPGDYELHIVNPRPSTRYGITVPAGVTFVAVDDIATAAVWKAAYREYFVVPDNTPLVRFFSAGESTFTIRDPSGATIVNQPIHLGNNIYQIATATAGTWSMNIAGPTNLRFLNIPQVIGFAPTIQVNPVPGGIIPCTTTADCSNGQSAAPTTAPNSAAQRPTTSAGCRRAARTSSPRPPVPFSVAVRNVPRQPLPQRRA